MDSDSSSSAPSAIGPRDDAAFMRRAIDLARRGQGQTAPNPMVGAVIVRDGEIVGEGYHARYGEAHAEAAALRDAGELARGATVYVSLEPCAHSGKTPPCADALIAAGVARVVMATRDPNPVAGGGAERLRAAGVEVREGVEEEAARELNAPFFHALEGSEERRRPWVTLKLALSIDGAVADADGGSRWITGPEARAAAHRLRAGSDAVAVGIGTVLADDPLLTVRDAPAPRVPPLRVVFDRRARTPLSSRLVKGARALPTLLVVDDPDPEAARALERSGVELLQAGSLECALEELARRDVRSLLVEGGARIAGALLERALVDRLIIFRGAVLLGRGARGAFAHVPSMPIAGAPRYRVLERRALGDDTMTTYALRPECSRG
ncbi:MAG TPA: bifunctional diaminohydroxyphosphoribosylaminopyrimidine deaminase/5-amino-6-(5-phosphoribosylamino)uracil reductase RibD [Gemmatimonadaceae bacterium]|nr:bifunctional diaminohydroxyphosphoribosylaminopyrimidine deaminase/5-amino-6-(5-phosphoribosylamino)uracil reductase RibD [Gemmatimonadaceae bacterium]